MKRTAIPLKALLIALALIVPTVVGTSIALAATPNATWKFAIHDDKDGNPRGDIFLVVDGRPHLIARHIDEHMNICPPSDYATRHIPARAITA